MFEKIKNIIFDLGDVLINLDTNKTIKCFDGAEITAFYNSKLNPDFVKNAHQFERGEITSIQFRKNVCNIFNINVSSDKFDECWNAMIGIMPTNRLKMLENLKNKYRIFVLSNTNEIHYNYFSKEGYWDNKLFEKVYFSHHLKMRKPESRIYKHILSENNLIAEETLFVDDNKENIISAKKIGIKGIVVNSEIENILKNINIYK